MSCMVASCDCLFRLIGGTLSMPFDIACGLDGGLSKRRRDASVAHLMTRTDQPRLTGSELSTSSNSVRFSGVSVLESGWCQGVLGERTRRSPAKPSWSRSSFHATGQYATPYTSGPRTGPRPASSTPRMYGPGAVGVGEWCEYDSVMGCMSAASVSRKGLK